MKTFYAIAEWCGDCYVFDTRIYSNLKQAQRTLTRFGYEFFEEDEGGFTYTKPLLRRPGEYSEKKIFYFYYHGPDQKETE